METCKWFHYKDDSVWNTPCGRCQGIKVRPNQKTCYCVKEHKRIKIERIELDQISPSEIAFQEMIKQFRNDDFRSN